MSLSSCTRIVWLLIDIFWIRSLEHRHRLDGDQSSMKLYLLRLRISFNSCFFIEHVIIDVVHLSDYVLDLVDELVIFSQNSFFIFKY